MSLPAGVLSEKFMDIREVVIAPGAEEALTYDGIPDQVVVYPRLSVGPIITELEILPVGAKGGGRIRVRGTGPWVAPGVTQQLKIRNGDALSRTLVVIAQKGYLPASVVLPVTEVEPTSVMYQSSLLGSGSATFTYEHVTNGPILVLTAQANDNGNASAPSAVTVGGVSAVLVTSQGAQEGAVRACAVSAWITGDQQAGTKTITITDVGTIDMRRIYVFSFDPGVGLGDNGAAGDTGGGTFNVNIVGQQEPNLLIAIVAADGVADPGAVTEGSGKVRVSQTGAITTGTTIARVAVYRGPNLTGSQLFNWTFPAGNTAEASVAVEIFLP